MPLALTDPRWLELRSSYGDTSDIVAWLKDAQHNGLSEDRLGELINEVQHQGGTSTAMYAVATHLVALARAAPPERAFHLLTHAGMIYADSEGTCVVPCPSFIEHEFDALASEGAKMLAPLVPLATNFDSYKCAVAALAGFLGHHSFARFLDGLDLYQGQFHHTALEEPFPPV
jgi:hypothetical protein